MQNHGHSDLHGRTVHQVSVLQRHGSVGIIKKETQLEPEKSASSKVFVPSCISRNVTSKCIFLVYFFRYIEVEKPETQQVFERMTVP